VPSVTRLRAVLATAAVLAPVVLAVSAGSATAAAPTRYVALGDSYAAAPLVPDQTGTPAGCFRSTQNYPRLAAQQLGATLTDVSCSGAETRDMTNAQSTSIGTNPAQLTALTADTGLVTLTIGGNDIGFTSIIEECTKRSSSNLAGAACKKFYNSAGHDELEKRISDTGPKVASVLSGIKQRAPHARVALVGYPDILPDTGLGCYPVLPFSPGDTAYLRGIEKSLNSMLRAQAASAGVAYVDTYTPSIGHDACTPKGTKWVEGIIPTSPAFPVHPNALGTAGQAAAVVAALDAAAA
jgi:lysophospholipase L1-like esterase